MRRVDVPVRALDLTCGQIRPADKPHVVVEKEISLRLTIAHKNARHGVRTGLRDEPDDIQIRDYVHIMNQKMSAFQ